MPNTLILQELKRLILIKSGIRVISPSDCLIISLSINKELKKNISETTVKRLFGFALIKHEFSKFTINTLMEYVGLIDGEGVTINQHGANLDQSNEFEQVRARAERISHYTLLNIRNRCNIPYKMTIPREHAKEDFSFFIESSYKFSALISQAGSGKSILLSHILQNMFFNEHAPFKKDLVVFLNADDIFNKAFVDFNFEERIKSILGLQPDINLFNYFEQRWKTNDSKLLIIIDSFSDLIVLKNTKFRIVDHILEFISKLENTESIKVLLSIRSTTWTRFYEKIRKSNALKKNWYLGSYFHLSNNTNVPLFSDFEIVQLLKKMSTFNDIQISNDLKFHLKCPFNVQSYYQLKTEYPGFETYTNTIYYEFAARYVEEKIYNSTYATEKVLFCKKIIELTKYGQRGYNVLKNNLIKEMPMFSNAYDELLSHGITIEEKHLKSGLTSEFVRFIHPQIFEYFLFVELYEFSNQKMDKKYFSLLNNNYKGETRLKLLEWSIRLMVRLHLFRDMEVIFTIGLNNIEKNQLICFMAESVNLLHKKDDNVKHELKAQGFHEMLTKRLRDFDFIDKHYHNAVKHLVEVADDPENGFFLPHSRI